MERARRSNNTVVPLWTILIFLLFCGTLALFLYFQFKPTIETRTSQVRSIPPEVSRSFPKPPLSQSVRVPILLYHYVENVSDKRDTMRVSLNIPPHIFASQVQTLKNADFTFMTVGQLGKVLDGKMNLPNKPVILTFDDGYRDFYTDVFPILKKHNVKATQYIISGVIGKPNYMFGSQIKEIMKSGLVEIGAHTVHHTALAGKLPLVVQYEVKKSKTDLERNYKIKIVSFAYPNGEFDEQAISVVKNAGFETAVSTVAGINQSQSNRYFLYRLRPGFKVGEELLQHLEQIN